MVKRVAFGPRPSHIVCALSFFFFFFLRPFCSHAPLPFWLSPRGRGETCDGLEREQKKLAGRERFMLPSVRGRSRPRFSRNPAVDLKGWAHVLVAAPNASTSPAGAKEREKMMGERFALSSSSSSFFLARGRDLTLKQPCYRAFTLQRNMRSKIR